MKLSRQKLRRLILKEFLKLDNQFDQEVAPKV